jgi:hypothetical protein
MIHFVLPAGHEFTVGEYLSNAGRDLAGRIRPVRYGELAAQPSFERGTYVLAGLEVLGPGMRRLLEELCARLSGEEGVRFLNHPVRTLRRFELLEELRRLGRNEFRAVRAAGDLSGLRYPVFVRPERLHSGAASGLLESPREVEAAIGGALLSGHRLDDLLVVEFCDTADAAGFYRKYAAFVVGDRVLARSLEYGRAWMLKDSRNEFSRAMVEEERAYVFENPHAAALREIFRIARVEYGRIDYAVKDGRVQTWEINLHPTIGPDPHPPRNPVPEALKPVRRESRARFYAEFRSAWEAVDGGADGHPRIPISLDPETVRAASGSAPREGGVVDAARRILRPARPLLKPLSRPFHGLLGRKARAALARRSG